MGKKLLQEVAHIDTASRQQQALALFQKFRELADVGRVGAYGKRRQTLLDSQVVEKAGEHTRVGFRSHDEGINKVCALSDIDGSDEGGALSESRSNPPLPTRGKQALGAAQPALLVLVVSRRSAFANLFVILAADPAVERAFQCVGLRSHQIGRP